MVAAVRSVVAPTCARPPARPRRQVAALEALQIYAPLGHALGMGRLTAQLEDCCFQVRVRRRARAAGRCGTVGLELPAQVA